MQGAERRGMEAGLTAWDHRMWRDVPLHEQRPTRSGAGARTRCATMTILKVGRRESLERSGYRWMTWGATNGVWVPRWNAPARIRAARLRALLRLEAEETRSIDSREMAQNAAS